MSQEMKRRADPEPACGNCIAHFDDEAGRWIIDVPCPNPNCYCDVTPGYAGCVPNQPFRGPDAAARHADDVFISYYHPITGGTAVARVPLSKVPRSNAEQAWLIGTVPDQSGERVSYEINLQRLNRPSNDQQPGPIFPPIPSFEHLTVAVCDSSGRMCYQSLYLPVAQDAGFAELVFEHGRHREQFVLLIKLDRSRSGLELPERPYTAKKGGCKGCGQVMKEVAELRAMVAKLLGQGQAERTG
jgi:hypothetical protein